MKPTQDWGGGDGWGDVCADSALVGDSWSALVSQLHSRFSKTLKKAERVARMAAKRVIKKRFQPVYLRLYSSLSLFTLARTLYRALISGVMVSIWTPTPSGCTQDTPGLVRRSTLGPNLRMWL